MNLLRKSAALGLAVLMVISSNVAFAAEPEPEQTTDLQGKVAIVEDDMLQQGLVTVPADADTKIVTVSDIDSIVDERLEAVVEGDQEKYDELTEILRSYGVEEVTLPEIAELTGEDIPAQQSSSTHNGITYETYNTTYKYNGKSYEILRILATPVSGYTNDTILYKSGDIVIKNSKPAGVNAMYVLKSTVSSVAGLASDKIAVAQTVYNFFKGIRDQVSSTSEITNIKASYDWNTALACSFIYVRENPKAAFDLRGVYHKASASIGVTIPQIAVKNYQNIETSMLQNSHSGIATPVNYDNTLKAVQGFINKKQYQSSVEGVKMTGVEGKTIKNMNFNLPMTPAEAGY